MRIARVVTCALVAAAIGATQPAAATEGATWSRTIGGGVSDVAVAPDGHIYVTGAVWAPPVGGNASHRSAMVVTKYGPEGGLHWKHTWRLRREAWGALGTSIAVAPGGGVYVGGASSWYEDEYPMLWRYSASGRQLWRRRLGVEGGNGEIGGVAADADGVVVALNAHGNFDDVRHDGEVRAFDPAGRPRWRTDFEVPGITGTWDATRAVGIGPDGRIYAAGHVDRRFFDSPDDPAPDEDVAVQQLTRSGRVAWTRVLADGPGRDREEATDVAVKGGLLVVSGSIDRWTNGWIGAFGTDGRRLWGGRWGEGYETAADGVAISPWGPVYVVAHRVSFEGGGDMRLRASIRMYGRDGTFFGKRAIADDATGRSIAAHVDLYVTVDGRLERWPR